MSHNYINTLKKIRAWLLAKNSPSFDRLLECHKSNLLHDIHGTVLEIGPGTGANLRYLQSDVTWLGVEPNHFMHRYLKATMKEYGIRGQVLSASAEHIPLKAKSVDTVISTLVLCSVSDPQKVLNEIKRVLKPTGKFLYIEHIPASPGTWMCRIQKILKPIWSLIANGCQLDRDIGYMIANAGFGQVSYTRFKLPLAVALTRRYIAGRAT